MIFNKQKTKIQNFIEYTQKLLTVSNKKEKKSVLQYVLNTSTILNSILDLKNTINVTYLLYNKKNGIIVLKN